MINTDQDRKKAASMIERPVIQDKPDAVPSVEHYYCDHSDCVRAYQARETPYLVLVDSS